MDNKTGKYFKYAIGEIVLVVIGILIALQINTWNEERKESNEEIAILESLNKNLTLAKKQSELLIKAEIELKKSLLIVLNFNSKDTLTNKEIITNDVFISAIWSLETDFPILNTYTDLKNTNKLRLVKNQIIKEKFTRLEITLNELKGELSDRLTVHQIRIDNVAENDINFIPFVNSTVPELNIANEAPNDLDQLVSDQRIRNLLGIKLYLTQSVLGYRESVDKELKQLTSLIEAELEVRK